MSLLPLKKWNKFSLLTHKLGLHKIDALLFPCSVNFQSYDLGKYYHEHCNNIISNKIKNVPYLGISSISFLSSWCRPYFIALDNAKSYPNVGLLTSFGSEINNSRSKSTKKSQKRPEYDSDTDSDVEEDLPRGTKFTTIRLQSLRMDGLLKKALNIARNKVESAFYEGSIRVNGKKPDKKSFQLRIGDEVDLIKGPSPLNPDYLSVSRIEVESVNEDGDDADEILVKVKVSKNLNIENYQTHPWKHSGSTG